VQLSLDVDVDKFKYNGVVDITIQPQKDVEQVTMHSNGLKIGKTEVSERMFGIFQRKCADVLSVTEDKNLTTITFHLSKSLKAGKNYRLAIEFDGEIKKGVNGLYRASYKVGNETR